MPQIVSELTQINTVASTQYIIVYDRDNNHELYITKVENFRGSSIFFGNGIPPLEPNNIITDRLITTWLDGDVFIQEDANMRVWVWNEDTIQWVKRGVLNASKIHHVEDLVGNGASVTDPANKIYIPFEATNVDFVHDDLNDGDYLTFSERGLTFGPYDSTVGLDLSLAGMKTDAMFVRNARTITIENNTDHINLIQAAVSNPLSFTGRPMDGDEIIIHGVGQANSGGYRYRYSQTRYDASDKTTEAERNLEGFLGDNLADPIRYPGRTPGIFNYSVETPADPPQDDSKYRDGDSVFVPFQGKLLIGYKHGVQQTDPLVPLVTSDYFESVLSVAGARTHRSDGAPAIDDALYADGDQGIFSDYRTPRQYGPYRSGKTTVEEAWGTSYMVLRANLILDKTFADNVDPSLVVPELKPSVWKSDYGLIPVVGDKFITIQGLTTKTYTVDDINFELDTISFSNSVVGMLRGNVKVKSPTAQPHTWVFPSSANNAFYTEMGLDPRPGDQIIVDIQSSLSGRQIMGTITSRNATGVVSVEVTNPNPTKIHDLAVNNRPTKDNSEYSLGDYAVCDDRKIYGPYNPDGANDVEAWPEKADLNRTDWLTDTGAQDLGTVRRLVLENGVIKTQVVSTP